MYLIYCRRTCGYEGLTHGAVLVLVVVLVLVLVLDLRGSYIVTKA